MKGSARRWASLASLAAVVAAVLVAVPSAWGGQPEMERADIDEVFFDEGLSEECGVDVWGRVQGHIISRSFDDGKRLVALNTLNIAITATAGDNTYRFRDVGADQVLVTENGAILSIIGQIPFDFNGVLKINLDTEEVVHEPGASKGYRLEEACAALTA